MKRKLNSILKHAFLLLLVVLFVCPIIFTITSSFKSNSELLAYPDRIIPHEPTFSNYIEAWNSDVFSIKNMLFNSIYYTLANVVIVMLISSMAGYVFARGNFKGKKIVFACFASLMFIKLGGISVYATFKILNFLHITQSLPALILINLFGVPIVNIYLVKGYIDTIQNAIDEAARIDGASFPGIFFRIIMPLLKPILATVGILAFQASWNDYLMPTIFTVNVPSQRTLIVGLMALKNSGGSATQWNLMLAGAAIALVPVIVAYTVANRYFISGLAAGAVKG